ncbi:hypothetical protein SB96558_0939 [Shigella boydii 965-58]|nr:hypothetical protein SB96558_0939 [Shigella boydii 965-58]
MHTNRRVNIKCSNQPSGGSRNINKWPGHQINMRKKFRFGGVVVRD